MNDLTHREVAVLNAALDLHTSERGAYLDEACAGDAVLRKQVEALLQAHEQAKGFMDAPPGGLDFQRTVRVNIPLTERAGDRIGRYKLLQQIGEGGCGIVYMAEQEEPVRRRVALKVIKLGMDTRQVIARFEAERQALALMDHPNIAKIHDAGITGAPLPSDGRGAGGEGSGVSAGRPYFVMELVRGIKITDFCDENKLSTADRLKLFIQVCQAIQHAHQKGIIHRDIKPSNILVTINDGVPVPKVIDFGIAKATQGRLTDQTLFTAFEQFIGTPAYMSPEQAVLTSLDIDTRSDIYSLGVLLYELLTGRTPFDQKELLSAGLDEMRRTIREKEPPKPSTRLGTMAADALTTTAKQHHTDAPKLIHLLRGDLDWIVMKSLDKDRARRYETANGLAMDVERHLRDEPVTARPPSTLYRLQKSIRRNKTAFAAAAAIAAVLVIGVVVSTLEAVRATRAQRVAVTKEQKSQQVAQFLKDMLSGVGPWVAMGRDTTLLRDIVDKTAGHVDKDLKDQPEVQAELLGTLGNIYCETGPMDKGEALQRESLAIRRRLFGEENLDVASSLYGLGYACWLRGKYAEAENATRESLTIRTKILGEHNPQVANSLAHLGGILFFAGKMAEAEAVSRKAVQLRRELGDDSGAVWALEFLGQALDAGGKYDEAETTLREAVAISKRQVGAEHVLTANALRFVGYTLHGSGRLPEAENVLRESLAIHRKASDQHASLPMAWTLDELASVLNDEGKYTEAENLARETLAIKSKMQSNDVQTVKARNLLIQVMQREGKLAEANALLEGQTNTPAERKPEPH